MLTVHLTLSPSLHQVTLLIEGSGAQSPVSIAEQAVKIMYDYVEGKQVEERYPVETFLITSDNEQSTEQTAGSKL